MTHMKKAMGVLVALALTACGRGSNIPEVAFEDGLPGQEAMTVTMPEQQGQGLTAAGAVRAQAAGDVSGMFLLTVGATATVNLSTAWALGALSVVVHGEPTTVNGDVAVFGPHTPLLSDTTWKLTMTRTAPNAFSYVLEGKPKGAEDTAYVAVISGNHTVAISDEGRPMKGYGEGSFLIEWDKASGGPQEHGSAEVRYARNSPTSEVSVELDAESTSVGSGNTTSLFYRYAQVPGGEGSFEWASDSNLQAWSLNPTFNALERLTIKSRWLESGEGRSDVRATGGDLTVPATVSECWDANFRSTFLSDSTRLDIGWGTEAQACVYKDASYVQE